MKRLDKPFDPTKPVQTRDGRAARIIGTMNHYCWGEVLIGVHTASPARQGAGKVANGEEICFYSPLTGDATGRTEAVAWDLVNVPVKTSTFFNLYVDARCFAVKVWATLELARTNARKGCLGQAEVRFEDGVPISVELILEKDSE